MSEPLDLWVIQQAEIWSVQRRLIVLGCTRMWSVAARADANVREIRLRSRRNLSPIRGDAMEPHRMPVRAVL